MKSLEKFLLNRRTLLAALPAAGAAEVLPNAAHADSAIMLNDASGLDATPVARHIIVAPDVEAITLARLRGELKAAAAAKRPVAMGIARHSMGGQSLARDGTDFTFDTPVCMPDRSGGGYRAQIGTRWRDVIAALDPIGFSPAVMQAYNDFGVPSAFSVNSHGWPVPHGPFGSTVKSLRLLLADGSLVKCSRTQNPELFNHAMGGYGLFGIIFDLDVQMVSNVLLSPSYEVMASATFPQQFLAVCGNPRVNLAYGRLDVSRENFFEQAILVAYSVAPSNQAVLPKAKRGGIDSWLVRDIYRSELGSDMAKRFRWFMETVVEPKIATGYQTRNQILNEPVKALAGHDPRRTDILHEYFLPPQNFFEFVTACQKIIPRSKQDLLNVTLRFVAADHSSVLAYAPEVRIALVMSFSQEKTAEAEADMQCLTRSLIDAALAGGGSFYLPYRLHARPNQVARAYPALAEFIARKRQYDPGLLFRNAMWDKWLA